MQNIRPYAAKGAADDEKITEGERAVAVTQEREYLHTAGTESVAKCRPARQKNIDALARKGGVPQKAFKQDARPPLRCCRSGYA